MVMLSERKNTPISDAELQRRWAASRAAMKAAGIDALLMQNNNDHMGGYVRWFTDVPATNGYPVSAVFPKDDGMTLVRQGPFGLKRELPELSDGVTRGVKTLLGTPSYSSAVYTKEYDPELLIDSLRPYAKGTIGLLGTYQMSFALVDYMKRHLPEAKFVDASDMIDKIKVLKSPEEMDLCVRTAHVQDGAMHAAFAALRPGMTDAEVASVAQQYCHAHGTEMGIYLCASWAEGQPAHNGQWHVGSRVIQKGDVFTLLVETNGPGGMYCELGRTAVAGKASAKLKDEFAFTLEARKFTNDLLKPGTPCATIWNEYNAFMQKNGRPPESRLYCHGQGYDLVERPLIRHDEPMAIQAGMNIVVHPTYEKDGVSSWVCDNYPITENGPGERMHQFPEEIVELAV
jgi:Xaa-Pro aminopeptidase